MWDTSPPQARFPHPPLPHPSMTLTLPDHLPESLQPGGAWRPLVPGSPDRAEAPRQDLSGPRSASGPPRPGHRAATVTAAPMPLSPSALPGAPRHVPAVSHHPCLTPTPLLSAIPSLTPQPQEPAPVFLAAPLGSLWSGHAPGVSLPHWVPPGSAECPRKQTP